MSNNINDAVATEHCIGGDPDHGGGDIRIFYNLTLKMEEIENYKTTLNQIREVMRFATRRAEEPRCAESGLVKLLENLQKTKKR